MNGEALMPNFYGPITDAHEGRQEPYLNAPGGQRLVQYFDKGRLELGPDHTVTSGLLATELVTGKIQTGDQSFETRPPPAIAIAGDPTGPGPRYSDFAGNAAPLLAPAASAIGKTVSIALAADGTPSPAGITGDSAAYVFAIFDLSTHHNVPAAFANLRTHVGIDTVGYAISEPFMLPLHTPTYTGTGMAQIFQRRVLTYNPGNPEAFRVEFGNIGQQYYQWRHGIVMSPVIGIGAVTGTNQAPPPPPATTAPATPSTALHVSTVAPVATPGSTAIAGPTTVIVTGLPATVHRGAITSATVQTNPGASCTIVVSDKNGPISAVGLERKIADASGTVIWTWAFGAATTVGKAQIAVACTGAGTTASTMTALTVT